VCVSDDLSFESPDSGHAALTFADRHWLPRLIRS